VTSDSIVPSRFSCAASLSGEILNDPYSGSKQIMRPLPPPGLAAGHCQPVLPCLYKTISCPSQLLGCLAAVTLLCIAFMICFGADCGQKAPANDHGFLFPYGYTSLFHDHYSFWSCYRHDYCDFNSGYSSSHSRTGLVASRYWDWCFFNLGTSLDSRTLFSSWLCSNHTLPMFSSTTGVVAWAY